MGSGGAARLGAGRRAGAPLLARAPGSQRAPLPNPIQSNTITAVGLACRHHRRLHGGAPGHELRHAGGWVGFGMGSAEDGWRAGSAAAHSIPAACRPFCTGARTITRPRAPCRPLRARAGGRRCTDCTARALRGCTISLPHPRPHPHILRPLPAPFPRRRAGRVRPVSRAPFCCCIPRPPAPLPHALPHPTRPPPRRRARRVRPLRRVPARHDLRSVRVQQAARRRPRGRHVAPHRKRCAARGCARRAAVATGCPAAARWRWVLFRGAAGRGAGLRLCGGAGGRACLSPLIPPPPPPPPSSPLAPLAPLPSPPPSEPPGIQAMVPGSEGIANPSDPTPEQAPIQAVYNVKASPSQHTLAPARDAARACRRVRMARARARPARMRRPGERTGRDSSRTLARLYAAPPCTLQVIQLAFLVACLYTGVGVLRMGFLIHFLSHSVITGFTSGAAIIIGLSQVRRAAPALCLVGCGGSSSRHSARGHCHHRAQRGGAPNSLVGCCTLT